MVHATPDSSREELEVCLSYLVDQAKLEARRGFAGIYGARYAALHANIDMLLASWQQAPDVVLGAD
jgi:hypothetical protein